MKPIFKRYSLPLMALTLLAFTACKSSKTTSERDLVEDSQQTKETISTKYPAIGRLFDTSEGYAIFPNVGKGAYIIGGASGDGAVYKNGTLIGYSDLDQVDVGLQIGGKTYAEVLFFQNEAALNDFKAGDFELTGNASAVILKEGVSGNVEFTDGVAVVTMPRGGAMAGISVGGQSFEFFPVD